jgi:hypothetical protein
MAGDNVGHEILHSDNLVNTKPHPYVVKQHSYMHTHPYGMLPQIPVIPKLVLKLFRT